MRSGVKLNTNPGTRALAFSSSKNKSASFLEEQFKTLKICEYILPHQLPISECILWTQVRTWVKKQVQEYSHSAVPSKEVRNKCPRRRLTNYTVVLIPNGLLCSN